MYKKQFSIHYQLNLEKQFNIQLLLNFHIVKTTQLLHNRHANFHFNQFNAPLASCLFSTQLNLYNLIVIQTPHVVLHLIPASTHSSAVVGAHLLLHLLSSTIGATCYYTYFNSNKCATAPVFSCSRQHLLLLVQYVPTVEQAPGIGANIAACFSRCAPATKVYSLRLQFNSRQYINQATHF